MLFDNETTIPEDFICGIIFYIKFYRNISCSLIISNFFSNILWCIVIYLRNKNQQNELFYSQFISIINLYMYRTGLLLIRRSFCVYTTIGICHAFMLVLIA